VEFGPSTNGRRLHARCEFERVLRELDRLPSVERTSPMRNINARFRQHRGKCDKSYWTRGAYGELPRRTGIRRDGEIFDVHESVENACSVVSRKIQCEPTALVSIEADLTDLGGKMTVDLTASSLP
jgi:hypothetical protein